ncbi:L-asparaginase [Janthinobacterium sp. CG23_2]|nr:L-asparaginase [Janthinobacterium sp. CG23_2]CUU29836.1 L-asparaginase [Janthinobacterium sp. CG23_2]
MVSSTDKDSNAPASGAARFARFDIADLTRYHTAPSSYEFQTIMSLRIIATGGTFDKHYDELTGKLGFAESHLPAVLARTRMTVPVALEQLPLLDSLDMQDADRARVLASCQAAPETAIVIVHGTDTMPDTAAVLGAAALGKSIVLTGAMIPYEIANSDALFNLGCATAAAQILPPGVYVAMNGQIFTWDNVTKNRAAGVFQPL